MSPSRIAPAPVSRVSFPLHRGVLRSFVLGLTSLLAVAIGSAQDYTFTTMAGIALRPGNSNGVGGTPATTMFSFPVGVAVTSDGTIYVADNGNDVIRKISAAGEVSTFVGTPGNVGGVDSGNASGAAVSFNRVQGPVLDSAGNLYVADYGGGTIRKITSSGTVSTVAGTAGTSGNTDATGAAARFLRPSGVAVDSAGNLYIADSGNHRIRKITSAGVVTTLAGTNQGSADGAGATVAGFSNPRGVAVDSAGNVYVADADNNTIRKITPAGEVSTFAGKAGTTGSTDATGGDARFNFPNSIAIDSGGNLFVADQGNSVIRKITSGGVVTTVAGLAQSAGRVNGTGSAARFDHATGVAVDSQGNIVVADYNNHLIRKITAAGVVTTVGGAGGLIGLQNGTGFINNASSLRSPTGIVTDSSGNVFVSDAGNNTIRKITPGRTVTYFAGNGSGVGTADGNGTAARFSSPIGLASDAGGNLYVADSAAHTIRRISSNGDVSTFAGTAGSPGSDNGDRGAAKFRFPAGAAIDGAGNLYVADYGNHVIRQISPSGQVSTLAGTVGSLGSTDGVGGAARFNYPRDVAVDGAGNIYVADTGNHVIRKITPGGLVTTFAGAAGSAGSADGGGNVARFNGPAGIGLDGAGNVFVADTGNSTIRKITPGGVVSTVGGTVGTIGTVDGVGKAALFNFPTDVAADGWGNIYVADNHSHTVRKGTLPGSTGPIPAPGDGDGGNSGNNGSGGSGSNLGTGSDSGDTTGTGQVLRPVGMVGDGLGNLYVCDTANNCIRLVTAAGVISTYAGSPGSSGTTDGTGTLARFNSPTGITYDSAGNLYVTDLGNSTIRKIASGGVVTTLAGTAGTSGTADGTGNAASFNAPFGIALDSTTGTDLYVTDSNNNTVRKVTTAGVVTTLAGGAKQTGDADGAAANARFNRPTGIAYYSSASVPFVLVVDTNNNTLRSIRTTTVDAALAGDTTTVVGAAGISGAYDGMGGNALLNLPQGLAYDSSSATFYLADTGNNSLRRISASWTVTTLAGVPGISGKRGGSGEQALFNQPAGVLVYAGGSLVLADTGNSILRSISLASATGSSTTVSTIALTGSSSGGGGGGGDGGSGGGGGGGAPSLWFLLILGTAAIVRISRRK